MSQYESQPINRLLNYFVPIRYRMDNFEDLYKDLKHLRLKCQPFESWLKVTRYVTGGGGSSNIIIIGKYKRRDIVIKLSPRFIKMGHEKAPKNNDIVEIVLYKYFTKKYILADVTPHIVGLYTSSGCPKLQLMFKGLRCPTMRDVFIKNKEMNRLCKYKHDTLDSPLIDNKFEMSLLEYCPYTVDGEMEKLVELVKDGEMGVSSIEYFIYRVCFQIIYTLACLQKKEKNFTHNDLFLRNILGIVENKYQYNDYVEYKIFGKSFYLPANGFYSKLNDFGFSVIYPTIKPNFVTNKVGPFPWNNWRFNDKKNDIFNFFHSFYDGQNLGSSNTMFLLEKHKMDRGIMDDIRNVFAQFLDTDIIDKINDNNRIEFDWLWSTAGDQFQFLQKTVKEPQEYLLSKVFKRFEVLPHDGHVVRIYSC